MKEVYSSTKSNRCIHLKAYDVDMYSSNEFLLLFSGFQHHTHWFEIDCYAEANLSSDNETCSKETNHSICPIPQAE